MEIFSSGRVSICLFMRLFLPRINHLFLFCLCHIWGNGSNMDRRRRELSEAGVYHIVMRGAGQSSIFLSEFDYRHFLEGLSRCTRRGVALEYLL